jgi:dihydrofolate synthase / folylpolyglutamate synthase
MTSYTKIENYLYTQLPIFQRDGNLAVRPGLKNIIHLCEYLGNPHQKFQSIHIAGTNGKGSTSSMIAAILQSAGYKVGLYTSPHLLRFTERIKINGQEIPEQNVVDFVLNIQSQIEQIHPSFFEITVAMAFDYFAQQQVDVAVIEVGMGGRLDSTNIITPCLSVITNIGYDHQSFLGNTLAEIAGEKAGIIKENIPVVISEKHPETTAVFIQKAQEQNAPIFFASDNIHLDNPPPLGARGLFPDLKGIYQSKNIIGVLQSMAILKEKDFKISPEHIKYGIENTISLTGLKGRWQIVETEPLVICDTGHNAEALTLIFEQLSQIPHEQLHCVLGFTKDKSINKILDILPSTAFYYFCQYKGNRALETQILWEEATQKKLQGVPFTNIQEAFLKAKEKSSSKDIIFVGGSTFIVSEFLSDIS